MDCNSVINERLEKINKLKLFLNEVNDKLLSLTKEINWDYNKLVEEKPTTMVTCSINNQHRVPSSKITIHEEKCSWHKEGYLDDDIPFSDHSGFGSFVTLTSDLINSITNKVNSSTVFLCWVFLTKITGIQNKSVRVTEFSVENENYFDSGNRSSRSVPKTSAYLDQNFNREEKLAIYDYVIANTQNQKSFSDLCMLSTEKKEEKKEMKSWEIAAAERDAKRRRASYRNKVHTSCKSHTEILREVIGVQMEILKEETCDKLASPSSKNDKLTHYHKRDRPESRFLEEEKKNLKYEPSKRNKGDAHVNKNYDQHSKSKDSVHERSPSFTGSDSNSRSRSVDQYRKWKMYERRSHFHKSGHSHKKASD